MNYLENHTKITQKRTEVRPEPSILDITIAIPTKNEERMLPGCLQAIGEGLVKRVVIIDSMSTDGTIDTARKFGAEVVDFHWKGTFPKKRNWFLRNYPFQTKWVLFLDADEYLTEVFKKELREALAKNEKVGYWLNYSIYFLGKRLKGGYPLKKLALFCVGSGEYERIDEEKWSRMDMEVHEHPVLTGEVGVIKSKIDHCDFRNLFDYVNKHNEYSSWEAKRLLKTVEDGQTVLNWTWKQRLKYRLMKSIWIGPAYFLGSFFLLGGFRDGARGLAFCNFENILLRSGLL